MQKNSTKSIWNVKNLVFMALLVAMQLVLTRVLVLDLGPYRITDVYKRQVQKLTVM